MHTLKNEEWRIVNIEGFERYKVSNYGRVMSPIKGGTIFSGKRMHRKGYPVVRLVNPLKPGLPKTFFVHRLVGLTFIDNPDNYPQINHKDCNKMNNHVSNLEWCTNKMNAHHAIANGIFAKPLRGEDHMRAKLTELQVLEIRDLFALGYTRRELAEKYNTKPSNIKDIVLRRSWKHI